MGASGMGAVESAGMDCWGGQEGKEGRVRGIEEAHGGRRRKWDRRRGRWGRNEEERIDARGGRSIQRCLLRVALVESA